MVSGSWGIWTCCFSRLCCETSSGLDPADWWTHHNRPSFLCGLQWKNEFLNPIKTTFISPISELLISYPSFSQPMTVQLSKKSCNFDVSNLLGAGNHNHTLTRFQMDRQIKCILTWFYEFYHQNKSLAEFCCLNKTIQQLKWFVQQFDFNHSRYLTSPFDDETILRCNTDSFIWSLLGCVILILHQIWV